MSDSPLSNPSSGDVSLRASTHRKPVSAGEPVSHLTNTNPETFSMQVLDSLEDYAVFTVDLEGKITSWNSGAERLLQYKTEEIIGQLMEILFTEEGRNRNAPEMEMKSALKDGQAIDERYYVRKDGSRFWGSGKLFSLKNAHGELIGFTKVMRDLTERRRVEERQQFLNRLYEVLASPFDPHKTLQEISQLVVPYMADYCRIVVVDSQGKVVDAVAHHTQKSQIKSVRELYERYRDKPDVMYGISRILKSSREEFIPSVDQRVLDSVHNDTELLHLVERLSLKSYLGIPLIARDRVVGAMTFSLAQDDRIYTEEDLVFAREVGHQVALAIDNARLYQEAQNELLERKKAEAALLEREEYYRFLAESMPQIVWTAGSDGVIDYANEVLGRYVGMSSSKVLKSGLSTFIHPEDLSEASRRWQESIQTGVDYEMEHRLRGQDGGYRWFLSRAVPMRNATGAVARWFGTSTDIDGIKKAEAQTARMAAIVSSSDDAIIAKTLQGIITSWNRAAEGLFGYAAEEAIGQHIMLIVPSELQHEEEEILRTLRQGKPIQHFETVRMTKSGERIPLSMSISPVRDSGGVIIGAANIARDVRERKRLERQKDDFIGIATHELKTPVTSIKAYAQTLQRIFAAKGDAQAVASLAKMDGQLDRLNNLIGDLLDVSKIESGRLRFSETVFDFDHFVAESASNLQLMSPKHQLVVEGRSGISVKGDQDRVGQVITNLVTNAMKYSPNDDKVLIKIMTEEASVKLSVQDFGIGISEQDRERVFERFYRVSGPNEKTFPGLGLGLYISSEIIKRLGGRIWVESVEGKGSIFYFTLPVYCAVGRPRRSAEQKQPKSKSKAGGKHG